MAKIHKLDGYYFMLNYFKKQYLIEVIVYSISKNNSWSIDKEIDIFNSKNPRIIDLIYIAEKLIEDIEKDFNIVEKETND